MTKAPTAKKAEDNGVAAATSANTTVDQNRIDFNDPTISGREAVERNLAAQKKAD